MTNRKCKQATSVSNIFLGLSLQCLSSRLFTTKESLNQTSAGMAGTLMSVAFAAKAAEGKVEFGMKAAEGERATCLLYTSDAADE